MFIKKPKETVLYKDEEWKYIELCVYCDSLKKYTKKWDKKGYSISHKTCEECIKENFE